MFRTALHQTIDNIRDNFTTTFLGVVTTTISLAILGTFILIYLNLNHITQIFFQNNHFSVILTNEISQDDQKEIEKYLNSIWKLKDLKYISPNQAKADILSSFKDAKNVLEKIDFSPLPGSFEFSLDRFLEISKLELEKLLSLKGVDEVIYGQETKDQVDIFFNIANFVGVFLISLLLISILIIIRNNINISIRIRLEEIIILKKLGATKNFIQLPYIFEGLIISFFSYFIALGGIYFLKQFIVACITYNESTYQLHKIVKFFSWEQIISSFLIILFLGVIASYTITKKIIKERS